MRALLDKKIALEAMLYVAHHFPKPTPFYVSKVLYFADKWSLEHVGRQIYWDVYIAMDNGPVPSFAYDLIKSVRNSDPERVSYTTYMEALGAFRIEERPKEPTLVPVRGPELDELSKTDLMALDYAIEHCKGKSFGQLSDESHDAAWEATPSNKPMLLKDIVRTIPNGDQVLAFLEALY